MFDHTRISGHVFVDAGRAQQREQNHETIAADRLHSKLFLPYIPRSKTSNQRKCPRQPRVSILSWIEWGKAASVQQSVIILLPMCCRLSWSIQRNRGCCLSGALHSYIVTIRRAVAGKNQRQSGNLHFTRCWILLTAGNTAIHPKLAEEGISIRADAQYNYSSWLIK